MTRLSRFVAVALAWAMISPAPQVSAAAFRALTPEGVSFRTLPSAPAAAPAAPLAALTAMPALPAAAPALAAPSLSAPALASVPLAAEAAPAASAPAMQKAAALPGLQTLAARTSAAKPGSAEAGAALNKGFDLSNAGSDSAQTPAVSGAESTGASSLAPAAPSARRASSSSRIERRIGSDGGAVNTKLIAIIGGVVLAVAIAIGALVHHGAKQDAFWKDSKAAADIVAVERATRAGDAEPLYKLAHDARARQAQEREAVADAKSRHADKIGSQSVSEVEKLAAFDGLAAARAELAANEVSKDPARRLGGTLTADWQSKLAALDAQAKSSSFEGQVGRELDRLASEVSKEL